MILIIIILIIIITIVVINVTQVSITWKQMPPLALTFKLCVLDIFLQNKEQPKYI